MAFLILLLIGFGFYMVMRNQGLQIEIQKFEKRLTILEDNLRRLHTKIVNQLPGFVEGEPSKPAQPQPEAAKPITPYTPPFSTPKPIETPRPIPPQPLRGPILPAEPARAAFSAPSIDWEKFMGVQLFAWLGGFALFLGMAFFVKYSIDHNLISPLMRVCIGFLIGVGVIIAGLMIRRKDLDVTVQTLCAAGISILYADTFACRSFYSFLSPEAAFGLMIVITVTSFLLAVRLNSRYVAILGLIGEFLTPPLMSTGVDHPIALFSYILLLDTGLAAVALKKRWGFLMSMAAASTLLMELGWTMKFFTPDKGMIGMGIYLLFGAFYLVSAEIGASQENLDSGIQSPAGFVPLLSMGFVANMLSFNALAVRPGIVLTLLLLLSVFLSYAAVRREMLRSYYVLGGLASFTLLVVWTMGHLKADLLLWGLGYYLAFAILHTVLPIVLQRIKPTREPFLWGYAAPILMLVLILFAMVFCDILSFTMWPFVMLLGMMAVAVAWFAGSLWAAMGTIALIMASFGIWLFRLPDVAGLPGILTLLAFFSCAFFAWALLVTRRASLFSGNAHLSQAKGISPQDAAQLPAFSALMPFMLLALVCLKLTLPNPSDVFGLMMLMVVLLLGLVRYRNIDYVAMMALLCSVAVEGIWHAKNFAPQNPTTALGWYLAFYAVFTLFPFVSSKHLKSTEPWLAGALAGPAHFIFLYKVYSLTIGKATIGFLPAAMAIPSLLGLVRILSIIPKNDERRTSLLAYWGGVSLFFITLIIPLQFDKEWITLGWALEGAALLWLYGRVSHEGLKAWGLGLLTVAFARLAMNPAVLSYHPRAAMPFLNWYLFVYGISILCFFVSAWLLNPPKDRFLDTEVPPLLKGAGTLLAFLLLNIEIADYYSTGSAITFQFSGNIAQDMTYSLAWAAFAIALLIIGVRKVSQGARYASLGLLTVTIFKVFLHDLWRLGQLFRVASFVGLAVVLMLVSFIYQKYVAKPQETSHV